MAIVNWLVQGCIVAALSAVVLHLLKNARAQSRYAFCSSALAIVLVLPLLTLVHTVAATTSDIVAVAMPGPLISMPHDGSNLTVALVMLCALWCSLCGLQFAIAIAALRRARRRCRAFPSMLESSLYHWTNVKARGRQARLMLSDEVRAAAVLSGPFPIIAVAPSVLDHLTAEEVDRLVIHEWAHVQRRDDAMHLVLVICRMVAGWHPAVSWLNRRLHEERESACDEMAIAVFGSPKAYAASLVKLADLPFGRVAPLPAVGALSSSGLAERVRRIVSGQPFASRRWSRNAVAASTVLLAGVASAVAALRIVEAAAAASTSEHFLEATDVQRRAVSRLDSRRPSESTVVAKRPEPPQGSPNTTPPRVVRSGGARGEQTLLDRDAVATSPAAVSPDQSVLAVLPASPLPPMDAPTSGEPVPTAESRAPSQGAVAAPQAALDTGPVPPWTAAANAGRAVGQGSKNAGIATGGFFTRLSKRIAGSF